MKKIKEYIHRVIIPSEHNNFRVKSLHTNMLTVYLGLAIGISILFRSSVIYPFLSVLGISTDITVEKLYQLTNEQRIKYGLNSLSLNEMLNVAARKKAEDMFAKNYWAHFGPNGETPWTFILQSGYQYEHAGENLAKNFMFSEGVIQAWMDSPTHKENIIRPVYTDVGFAVVNGILENEETTLVVQMFGTPKKGIVEQFADTITPPLPNNQIGGIAKIQPTKIPSNNNLTASKVVQQKYSTLKYNSITLMLTFGFLLFIFISFLIDIYIAERMGLFRITGKHFAHVLFLLTIIAAVLILKKGAIL